MKTGILSKLARSHEHIMNKAIIFYTL